MTSRLYLVSGICRKHSKGKDYEAETSALYFPDSWSLTSPRVMSERFLIFFLTLLGRVVEVSYFFTPCWPCTLTELSSAGPAALPRQGNVLCCMDSSLNSFSFIPIFHGTLILSRFPLQIGLCVSCASWHTSIKETFC